MPDGTCENFWKYFKFVDAVTILPSEKIYLCFWQAAMAGALMVTDKLIPLGTTMIQKWVLVPVRASLFLVYPDS